MKFLPRYISFFVIGTLVAAAIYALALSRWSNFFVILQAVFLSSVPYLLEHRYNISVSERLRAGIIAFLFCTLFLGEINSFYDQYFWWDITLHFFAGLWLTLIGFIILNIIYSKSNLRNTPLLTSLFAFSFAMMVAALWEIYEFTIDYFALAKNPMQPSNIDTMTDLIVALFAGLLVCVLGYRYLAKNEKNIAAQIIEKTG